MIREAAAVLDYSRMGCAELASKEPVGLGTGQAESAESFVERVRHLHDASRNDVYFHILGLLHSERRAVGGIDIPPLNSPSPAAFACMQRLAILTKRPQVARLGFAYMHAVIAPADLLRKDAVWCEHCLRDMYEGRRPVGVPLLWSLRCVEACPLHQVCWGATCHSCGCRFQSRGELRYPFYVCPKCRAHLFRTLTDDQSTPPERPHALQERLWVAHQLADLIAVFSQRDPSLPLEKPNLRNLVATATERGSCSGVNDLFDRAKVGRSVMTPLRAGRKASLNIWLRLAMAADVRLAGLFAPECWSAGNPGGSVSLQNAGAWIRHKPKVDREAINAEVHRRMQYGPPITSFSLAGEFGMHPQSFKRIVGPLALQLDQATAARRAEISRQRVEELADEIRKAAGAMRKAASRVTAYRLATRLGCGPRNREFVLAMRNAAPEVGLGAYVGANRIK